MNIVITVSKSDKSFFNVQLVNLLLPLHYRIEFLECLKDIYAEEELEANERLVLKKIIFLLVTIAMQNGVEDYK